MKTNEFGSKLWKGIVLLSIFLGEELNKLKNLHKRWQTALQKEETDLGIIQEEKEMQHQLNRWVAEMGEIKFEPMVEDEQVHCVIRLRFLEDQNEEQ